MRILSQAITEIVPLAKNKAVRNILLLSLAVAIMFPLINVFLIYPSFTQRLIEDTEDEAVRLASYMVSSTSFDEMDLRRESVTDDLVNELEILARGYGLVKLKVFSSSGEIIYSTDPQDIGIINEQEYFHEIVAKGSTHTHVVRKGTKSVEGQIVTTDVVETYIPIMRGDTFVGAFEIYYDITARQEKLDRLVARSSTPLFIVAFGLLAIAVTMSSKVIKAEEGLRESEEKLRKIRDSAQDAIIMIDNEGNVSFWNDAAERVFGYSSREALGQELHALIAPKPYYEAYREAFDRFKTTGQGAAVGQTLELTAVRKDGTEFPVELSLSAVKLRGKWNAVGIVRDITKRKRAEEEIRRLKEFNEDIVQSMAEGIVVQDAEGYLTFVNPAAATLLGYAPEELPGQHWTALVPSDQRPIVRAADERRARGETDRYELELVRKDGSRLSVLVSGSPRFEEGSFVGILAVFTDITERKRVEEALAAANAELEQAVLKANELAVVAEEASRAKSEFLANMSHEIRTPMNGIIGMTELALDTDLTPEQREYLKAVQTSAEALLGLLNDILDFSKIEAGRLELEEVDFDLRGVVEKVADIMAQRASEKGLELMLHVHPDTPAGVRGDPLRLRQVLVNLVGNAIKFTEQGEVIVEVKQLREGEDEVELLCSVADTGPGIPADKLNLIFESFSQAEGGTTRRYGGSGLGLTISKQLVEKMGGRIWVESEVGQGSTFYFTVVLGRQPDWVEMAPPEAVNIQGLRLLVIDDNATNRHILRETTHSFGCRPEEARDGDEGLHMLKQAVAEGDPFEMVLLDVQMLGMDGLDVLAAIRQTPELKSLVVIMLTSVDGLGSVAHRQDLGWSAYLTKPIKQSQLLDTMMNAMGKAAIEKGQAQPRRKAQPHPGRSSVSLRILLAEDNYINRRLARIILERAGHQVVSAEDGRKALDLLEQHEINLIFMDVQMPEMDGLETTAAIRANPRWAHIPIIAMTAHAMKGDRERILAAGMDDYVSKPIRAADVLAAIGRQMRWEGDRMKTSLTDGNGTSPAILDREGALERLEGDEAMFNEFIELFLEDATSRVDQIAEAIDRGNAESVERLAHNLKGGSASLGADRVCDAARRLETIGGNGDLSEASSALVNLKREVDLLCEHMGEAPKRRFRRCCP